MRVLHCIPSMEGGGAERQLTYLVRELRRLGVDTHVALVSRGANWDRLLAAGVSVHELRGHGSHDPFLLLRLLSTMRSVAPDLVQVWLRQMDVLGGMAALMLRKPLILTERASRAAYPGSVKHAVRIAIGRFASAIVANSKEGERYWRNRVGRSVRTCVIPNAVPVSEIGTVAPSDDIGGAGRRLVLFAGRLAPQKNIDVLLSALLLALEQDRFDVLLCGVGPLQADVEDWVVRNRLGDRVRLIGYSPALWSLMKRASVLVSPAVFEGTPNVVLEAMACRCPLVISDIPEHRAILDEGSALFADPSSPAQLASAIRSVLLDPEAARTRAAVAFARVERFNPAAIAQQYLDVYRSVVVNPCGAVRRAGA